MKKVAILTFHMAHNFGAMLQAYALENVINEFGVKCEILDYRFPYIEAYSGVVSPTDLIKEYGIVRGTIKVANRIVRGLFKKQYPMQKKFNYFMRHSINLSPQIYRCLENLDDVDYDTIVFGSDQIWNVDLTGGYAPEYFGEPFDPQRHKLISYAASSGSGCLCAEYLDRIKDALSRFSAVSVREEKLARYITDELHIPAETVVDPVFLLPRSKWKQIACKSRMNIPDKYILVYAFQTNNEIYDLSRRVSYERGLPIVIISYGEKNLIEGAIELTDCGPFDFVKLFRNADFVCTTSFHGMAFSIIFEKDFYCKVHPLYGERNRNLLSNIGLLERAFEKTEDLSRITSINYNDVNQKLAEQIEKSKQYLQFALFG